MPYAPLNHRDRTAEKIPAPYCGFGACLTGGGFALLVTVPVAIVVCLASPVVNQVKKKRAEKKAAGKRTSNDDTEDGQTAEESAQDQSEKERLGSPDTTTRRRSQTPVVCQGECMKDPTTFCAVHNKKPEGAGAAQTSGPSMLDV